MVVPLILLVTAINTLSNFQTTQREGRINESPAPPSPHRRAGNQNRNPAPPA